MKKMRMIMALFLMLGLLGAGPLSLAESASIPGPAELKTDVVLLAVPIAVKSPSARKTVDVLERRPEEMGKDWSIVIFRVERVLKGEFTMTLAKDPSLWSQVRGAADDKNILKLVTLDFEKPQDEPVEKNVFAMAVADPLVSFGITNDGSPQKQRYKISLSLVQKEPKSYIMVNNKKVR